MTTARTPVVLTHDEATRLARLARHVYWTEIDDKARAAAEPSENSLDAWRAVIVALRENHGKQTCPRAYWYIGYNGASGQLVRCNRPIGHVEDHEGPFRGRDGARSLLSWDLEEGLDL